MVDPVSLQHSLARAMIADETEETSKDKNKVDKKAFSEEFQRVEKVKESQIHEGKESGTENRIREQEEQKDGRKGQQGQQNSDPAKPKGEAKDSVNDIPQNPNPALIHDSEHKIDVKA